MFFNVIFVDNDMIQQINRDYRGIDRVTDVITFALMENPDEILKGAEYELGDVFICVERALEQAIDLIDVGGRICVITFHSLEDRIVKRLFKEKCEIDDRIKGLPNVPAEYLPDFKLVYNKAIAPSEEEIANNPRARSSKLRVIERVK